MVLVEVDARGTLKRHWISMKTLRLRRLLPANGQRIILTPLDHGVTLGPIPGLDDVEATLRVLRQTGMVHGVILHKGTLEAYAAELVKAPPMATILHLSGSLGLSPNPHWKVLVSTVEDGLRLGVDGVSVQVNLGNEHDAHMLRDLGTVASACAAWGMPLLAMMYLRGPGVDPNDLQSASTLIRVAAELGADLIKLDYPGDPDLFARMLEGVDVPILVAGGAFNGDARTIMTHIHGAVTAGAAGVAIGRNVFQRLDNPGFIEALDHIMNQGGTVDTACAMVGEE
jgi:class I fructose-bisphosphate aldolase